MDKETENQNVNQEEGLLANTPQTEEVEPKEEETTIPHKEEEKPQTTKKKSATGHPEKLEFFSRFFSMHIAKKCKYS